MRVTVGDSIRSLLLCFRDVYRVLINSFVCWFYYSVVYWFILSWSYPVDWRDVNIQELTSFVETVMFCCDTVSGEADWASKPSNYLIIIIKAFIKHKILSVEAILSAGTHAHTHALTHASTHARTHTHTYSLSPPSLSLSLSLSLSKTGSSVID